MYQYDPTLKLVVGPGISLGAASAFAATTTVQALNTAFDAGRKFERARRGRPVPDFERRRLERIAREERRDRQGALVQKRATEALRALAAPDAWRLPFDALLAAVGGKHAILVKAMASLVKLGLVENAYRGKRRAGWVITLAGREALAAEDARAREPSEPLAR